MDSPTISKDYQKRKQAMKQRLASLDKKNPVVAAAIKNQEPPQEDTKWKNWNVVDELVSAARHEYFKEEGESMQDCVANLASALSKLASKKGLDKGNQTVENDDSNEDY